MSNKIDFTKFDLEEYAKQYADYDQQKSKDGDAWFKCCFHEENTPSLHITDKQVFHCHGCGAQGGILDFIKQLHGIDNKEAIKIVKEFSGEEIVIVEREKTPPKEFFAPTEYKALYSYNDGFVLKYRLMNDSYIWTNYENDRWWVGTGNHDVGLYAPKGLNGIVILAEGEKDADIICEMGFNGASSPNGTYKWKDLYTNQLKNTEKIILLNDEDYPGIAGSQLAQRYLKDAGLMTKRVSPLEFVENNKEGFDISDVVEIIGIEDTYNKLVEIIGDEEGWDKLWNEEIVEETTEKIEVEVMWESGMGEEYDNLIHKAVQETIDQGFISELTEIEISRYSKSNNIGKRAITNRINERVKLEQKPKEIIQQSSAIMKIEDLGIDIDINGSGYTIDETTSAIIDSNDNEVIGHFLSFVGVVVDAETEQDTNVKIALAYNTPQNLNKIQVVVIPKKTMATSLDMIKVLSGYNINVTQANGLSVVQYLQDLQNFFNEKTVTMKSLSRFGWFNGYLMPYEQDKAGIIFDNTIATKTTEKLLEVKGNKEKSLDLIREVASYSSSGAVMIGAAVGSLILSFINNGGNQSFALNVWAGTGTGKTVTAQAIASIFGYPFKDGWWADGNATMNKDIYHNSLLGNLPAFIDDPALNRQYDSNQKRDYIYAVTSGQGRGRMQRTGDVAQDVREWCNVMIMTNETPFIDDSVNEGGARSRCIDVNFGGAVEIKTIERWLDLMTNNYGHFGSELAENIRRVGKHAFESQIKSNIKWFNGEGVEGKRAYNAAIIMSGLGLATGVFSLDPHKDTKEWLSKQIKASGELSDGARAYEKFMNQITINEETLRNLYDRNGSLFGVFGYAPDGKKIIGTPIQTILGISKISEFNAATLINWGYKHKKMYASYDDNGKPKPIMMENYKSRIPMILTYYDWLNPQISPEISNSEFKVSREEMEVINI